MIKTLSTLAVSAIAAVAISVGSASANVIQIAGGNGTITCSGAVEPACLAFSGGASGGLDTEADGAGTLIDGDPATEVAWYYDGTPAGDQFEADRLNILTGGTTTFDMSDLTKSAESPPLTFSTFAAYILLKLGNSNVFLFNNTGGELTVTLSSLGNGFGFSHYSEIGEVGEIPIPGAIWLMGAGLAGLGFAGRKKKRQA